MFFYPVNITTWLEAHQLPCLFKAVTHFDCPGCGMQRSFILLLRGDLVNSFITYPALLPIILLFAFLIIHLTFKVKNGTAILKYAYFFCAAFVMATYIYRLVTKTV